MRHNPVDWFEICVQDMVRAKKFHETVLHIRLEKQRAPDAAGPQVEMWAFPAAMGNNGSSGSQVKMPGAPSGGNSTRVYFSCVDCEAEAGRVAKAGARIDRGKRRQVSTDSLRWSSTPRETCSA